MSDYRLVASLVTPKLHLVAKTTASLFSNVKVNVTDLKKTFKLTVKDDK
jgi:hypothetical protein